MQESHPDNSKSDDLLILRGQIIDALNCGVLAYTIPGHEVISVNDTLKHIYGISGMDSNAIGRSIIISVIPEDQAYVREMTYRLIRPGDSVNYTFRIQKPNGEIATLKAFTTRRAFSDGREYILSVIENITLQEVLRVSLKHERQLYRDALTGGADCCFTFDLTAGIITDPVLWRGEDMSQLLELSLPAQYDEFCRRFLAKYDVRFADESMRNCYSCDGLRNLYRNGIYSAEANCFIPAMGIHYNALVAMSEDEDDGHLYALYFSRDTTDLRNREEQRRKELEDARQKLAVSNSELQESLFSEQEKTKVIGAISNVYIAIFHVNLETGAYQDVTDCHYLESIYQNYPNVADAFPRLITARVAPAFRESTAQFIQFDTLQERMKDKKAISLEYQTSEDNWVRSSIIEAKRREDGVLTEVLFATERIDEAKRKELAQQIALKDAYEAANRANEAKTNFLASMSHDIRTPMNAIIGMTAIAGTHLDDRDRVADCLSKITTSSKHLLGLINEVLDMNKIESGKLDLCVEEFNLSDLVDNLLTMVRPQVEARHHELVVNIHNVEHEYVVGDSQRIQQVFMNIMGNAVKYTPEYGRIELSISEKPTKHKLIGCYEFVFQDNGIGMKEDFIPHIFEAFSRAKDSVVENMQGTGLGMAITNNIVHMMNGDIKVESKLGEGSKFTVTIFLELQNTNETVELDDFADLPVLVVDDDPVSCETACTILCDLGMKAEWVLSGREAVELVARRREEGNDFMAVILDWKMPEMDGLATTRELRKKIGQDIPIVIISAYDWSDIEAEARSAGVHAFLSKPIFKSRIIRTFRTLMSDEKELTPQFDLEEFARKDFSGRRALLVEDNAINSEIAGEILMMTGLEVEYAYDGKEAVDRISEVEDDYYDIVLMDIQMPVMNGYEASRAIRSLPRAYTKRVPILAVTANAFAEDIQDAKNAGMNEHIAKPLNFEELLKALNRWLV